MSKRRTIFAAFVFVASAVVLVGCGGGSEKSSDSGSSASSSSDRQINLCILLDLSDRIEPSIHAATPSHKDRDIEAVLTVVEHFKSEMMARGAFFAKGKLKTIFNPAPTSPRVNEIARDLRIDLSTIDPQGKKNVFDNVSNWYEDGLNEIYDSVLDSKNYVGADIWRFFAEGQAADYCIDPSPEYDNTLVILTDGYIYHDNSVEMRGKRSSYVTGPLLQREGLRTSEWSSKMDAGDFGLISSPKLDGNLSILVMEINPSQAYVGDFSILSRYWGEWLEAMGVTKHRMLKTDIPSNTQETIQRFLSQ
jgi:hypothetical protein